MREKVRSSGGRPCEAGAPTEQAFLCLRERTPSESSSHEVRIKRGNHSVASFYSYSVREKIRTPDTLVRSQVLYPAELHTRIRFFRTRILY